MSIKKTLSLAVTLLAALPAAASAQAPVTPPDADNYLAPYFVHQDQPLRVGDVFAIQADTTNYTVQDDMFFPNSQNSAGGGPPEPTVCEGYQNPSTYGNTIWAVFHSADYGTMNVSAASGNFDEVIRVIPFEDPETDATPQLPGACYDDLAGSQESAQGLVFPNQYYAVQVGGTINASSPVQGGPMQVKFDLGGPPAVDGQAFLFWKLQPLRVTSLSAKNVTRGAKITLSCTKRACKTKRKTASKVAWQSPVTGVGPTSSAFRMKGGRAGGAGGGRPHKSFRPIAHSAATKFTLLKNKRMKKGAKITLRITAPGFIGKHFQWTVKRNSITSAKVRCTDPGSSKPKRTGTCHG
jgi:hypothetical protein